MTERERMELDAVDLRSELELVRKLRGVGHGRIRRRRGLARQRKRRQRIWMDRRRKWGES